VLVGEDGANGTLEKSVGTRLGIGVAVLTIEVECLDDIEKSRYVDAGCAVVDQWFH